MVFSRRELQLPSLPFPVATSCVVPSPALQGHGSFLLSCRVTFPRAWVCFALFSGVFLFDDATPSRLANRHHVAQVDAWDPTTVSRLLVDLSWDTGGLVSPAPWWDSERQLGSDRQLLLTEASGLETAPHSVFSRPEAEAPGAEGPCVCWPPSHVGAINATKCHSSSGLRGLQQSLPFPGVSPLV